jgi:predicted nucleic acid-binding protein
MRSLRLSKISAPQIAWTAILFMTEMRFADSNILLYAISKRPSEKAKAQTCRAILRERDLALSVQVLQEFYVQATRINKPDRISHETAVELIRRFRRFPVQDMTLALLDSALVTRRRYEISYWDAAIIEAARTLGCSELITEDLNHGQDFGGVRVVNPFRDA